MTSGVQVGSAYVALGADASGLQRDLQKGESAVRGWASKLSGIFMTAGAGLSAGVTAPLLMLGNKAIDQASDMAESLSKVRVTFGDNAKGVEEFANSAAKNLGIAKLQALDAAGTFGNMFSAMGMGGQAAADMSLSVLQLGSDLGSFHNVDPTEMLQKLRSGLVGEAEPLRAMGILLTEATVKAQAMKMGLGDANGALTEGEKVQARYALIVEQSKNAMGDFARTSDGLANATRIQNATFQDLLGTIGTQLLPIKLQLAAAVQKVLTWFQQLNPETQRLAVIFGAVAAAAGPVLIMMGMVAGAVATLGAPLLLIIGALGLFAAAWATNFGGIRETVMSAIQPVIDAIQTAIGVFQALSGAGQTTSQSLIGAFTAFLGSLIGFEQASALVQKFREGWEQLAAFFEPTIERLKAGFAGMMEGLEPIGGKLDGLVGAFEGLWTAVEPIVQMLAEVIGGVLVAAFNLLLEVAAAVMPDIGNVISAAIDIAVTVLNTLATVVTEVVNIVTSLLAGDWASAWASAQTIVETLVTAVQTIFGSLVSIIGTILGDVLKGVMNWLTNLDSEWKNKLEGLLGTVKAKFYSILETIIMTMGNIKAAILGFDLKAAGAALIQGMIDGVTSKAAALVAAATGVVSNAVQAAKNLLGIHSPSTVFAEIGRQIIDGLSLGLSESEQVAIDAMAKVFENLTNIASALALLSGFRAAPGLLDNLNTMIGQIKEIIAALQDLAGWLGTPGNPSVVSAKAGTDPLVEIANNIKAMVEGLAALGEFKPVGDVAAKVTDLVDGYKEVIAQFYDLAIYLADEATGLGDAVGALGVMAVVADSFGVIFQAWSAVAKAGSLTGPKNMQAMLASISDLMTQVVATLSGLKLDVTDELIDFAGRLADLAGAFGDIAKSWETVSKFEAGKVDMTKVVGFLKDFAGQVMTALNDVSKTAPAVGEGFQTFLANVKGAIALIADTAKAWETVSDFQPNAKLNVETVTNWLASLAGLATRAIEKVQGWGGITPNETFNAFTTSVKGAIGLIADTAKAWETLQGFEWNSSLQIDGEDGVVNWLASLAGLATRAIERVQAWGGITPNETFNAFVASVKNAIGLISEIAKVWENLQDFKPNKNKIDVNAVVDWLASLGGLALRALEGVQKWGGITPDEAFNAFTTAIKNSLGALSEALKFTSDLALWKHADNVKGQMQALTADLKVIIDELWSAYVNMRGFVNDSLLKFVADVSALTGGLANVVALLKSIEDLSGTGDITFAVARIKDMITSVLEGMQDIIYTIDEEKGKLIQNFSTALSSLMGALKTALELAMAIPATWTVPDAGMWSSFITWTLGVFQVFEQWVTQNYGGTGGTERLNLVGTFATAFSSLMGALKTALELAMEVPATWTVPDAGMWSSFITWTLGVFQVFEQWVTQNYGGTGGTERLNLVATFATAFSSLMEALQTALMLAMSLPANWTVPTSWTAFDTWVKDVMSGFITYVETNFTGPTAKEQVDLIAAFSGAMSALMGALQTALTLAMSLPATWIVPTSWTAFDTWVKGVMSGFITYVKTNFTGPTAKEQVDLIAAFAGAMSVLMGALQTALMLAMSLPANWTVPTSWTTFDTWVKGVMSGFITYVKTNFTGPTAKEQVDLIAAFAAAMSSLMGALQTALTLAMSLPATWTVPTSWTAFDTWVKDVMSGFITYVETNFTGPTAKEQVDLIAAFSGAMSALMGALQTALTLAMSLPATWTAPTSWTTFDTWVKGVMSGFITYVKANFTGPTAKEQVDLVAAFGAAMSAVMGGLKTALDLALALPSQWAGVPTGAGSPYANLKLFVDKVWGDFAGYVAANFPANSAAAANIPVVKTFAEAMGAVMGALGSAMNVMQGLQGYIPLLDTRITNFIGSVTHAYGLVQTYATGAGVTAGTAATRAFAEATSAVFSALTAALGLFKALVEPGNGLTASVDDFRTRLSSLVSRISIVLGAWKTYVETEANTTWTPVSGAFKAKIDGVFGTLKTALDLFKDLNTAGMPSPTAISAFLTQVLGLFASFVTGIGQTPTQAATAAANTQSTMTAWANTISQDAMRWYNVGYAFGGMLAAGWQASMENQVKAGSFMMQSTIAVTDAIKAAIKKAFGIASPSTVMQGFGMNVAAGLGLGMLGGLPDVQAAAASLYQAAQPGMNLGGSWDVNNSRVITVRFEGQAGGGVPLNQQQFDSLKRDLAYAVRIGA